MARAAARLFHGRDVRFLLHRLERDQEHDAVTLLDASGITKRFAGITALDAISSAIAGKPWLPPLPAIS